MNKIFIITTAVIILALIFLLQNLSNVPLNFLFREVEMPRTVLMAITFAAGYQKLRHSNR